MSEVSPVCYSDPGMTNTNMQFAVLDVDADAPENQNINPELEVGTCCAVIQCADLPMSDCTDKTVVYRGGLCTGWRIH